MASKYFYLLSHDSGLHGADAGLALAECVALTGGSREEERIVVADACRDIARAAFTCLAAEEIARGDSLDELCDRVQTVALEAPGFHVEVVKIPGALPDNSITVQGRLGKVLIGRPDLANPKIRFIVVRTEAGYRFGRIVGEADTDWRQASKMLQNCSRSLQARIGRAMVNLVASPGERVLDPCCGAGTIPLQARFAGVHADASDINPNMVQAANANLAYHGFDATARVADALGLAGRWDAVVTDLPYGWFGAEGDRFDIEALLAHLLTLAPKLAVATAAGSHRALAPDRLRSLRTIPLQVSKKRTRFVHLAET